MIIAEPYQRDGRTLLRNVQRASTVPPGYVDTGLDEMPTGLEKLVWDGTQVVPFVPTDSEKLDRLSLPPRVLAALLLQDDPNATLAQRARAQAIVSTARAAIRAAL